MSNGRNIWIGGEGGLVPAPAGIGGAMTKTVFPNLKRKSANRAYYMMWPTADAPNQRHGRCEWSHKPLTGFCGLFRCRSSGAIHEMINQQWKTQRSISQVPEPSTGSG